MSRQSLPSSYPAPGPTSTVPAPLPVAAQESRGGWRSRLDQGWREAFAAQLWQGRMPLASATLATQVWAEASPWRTTAGWSMAAALLAAGALQTWGSLNGQMLVLLWLLVDLLWGALWRLAGGRPHLLTLKAGPASEATTLRLPYIREGSPAAQLMRLDEQNSIPYLVRVAFPTLLLTLVVAAALGLPALVATALLAAVAVGGWTLRRTLNTPPLLLHAVATVLLPWLLVSVQWQMAPAGYGWGANPQWNASLGLALCWTLHAWGEGRATVWVGDRLASCLLGAAQVGILAVLVINHVPIWVPLTAVLLMPTWLRLMRRQPLAGPGGLAPWWLAALITSALALGWQ